MEVKIMNKQQEHPKVVEGIHYKTGKHTTITINKGKIADIQLTNSDHMDEGIPWIGPGLIDLQINGYNGNDFNTLPLSIESIQRVVRGLWSEGVTSFYPTVITNSDQEIEEALRTIAKACSEDQHLNNSIAGIHLEGPFLSPEDGPRGAHQIEYIKSPDWTLLQRWQEAAGGRIKILTLSPEWPKSEVFIQKCTDSGVTVSIGHTSASIEQIDKAVEAGARMSTHLGNGAHLMMRRHPNYIWEQLAQDDLWTCMIADGFHLPRSVLKVMLKTKGEKAMLVSDAVFLSGLEPGEYTTHIGGEVVLTKEGKLHLKENSDLLAGSAQMLTWGIEHIVRSDVCSFPDAWEMASTRPATFMELPTKDGLKIGEQADLVLFEKDNGLQIRQTIKHGNVVYERS